MSSAWAVAAVLVAAIEDTASASESVKDVKEAVLVEVRGKLLFKSSTVSSRSWRRL